MPYGAIRSGDPKLIEFFDDMRVDPYDLARDIGGESDLADREPVRARAMQEKLAAWRVKVGAQMPFPKPPLRSQGAAIHAAAGLRRGHAHGETDPLGWKAVTDPVTWPDFHATVLHLLGIDHRALTFYHNGIERRLTNVHGEVVRGILA